MRAELDFTKKRYASGIPRRTGAHHVRQIRLIQPSERRKDMLPDVP